MTFGAWYGDPRIDITLEGEGQFVVRGGIQRFSDTRVFRVTLACDQVLQINKYKVKAGRALLVYVDGVLTYRKIAPHGIH